MGLLGALIGAGAGLYGSAQANQFSAGQTKSQFSRALYMSSTAHQREVEDLKKAGLNPVLSAGGSGAPMGSLSAASAANLGQNLTSGIAAGSQVRLASAQTKSTNAQAESTRLDNQKKGIELKLLREAIDKFGITKLLDMVGAGSTTKNVGTVLDVLRSAGNELGKANAGQVYEPVEERSIINEVLKLIGMDRDSREKSRQLKEERDKQYQEEYQKKWNMYLEFCKILRITPSKHHYWKWINSGGIQNLLEYREWKKNNDEGIKIKNNPRVLRIY